MRWLLLLSMGFLAPFTAVAQEQPPTAFPVEPGERIRLLVADATMTGTLVSQSSDTLYMAPGGTGQVAVPLASVRSLEVHRGKRIRALRVVGYGLAGGMLGGLIGAAIPTSGQSSPPPECRDPSSWAEALRCEMGEAFSGIAEETAGVSIGATVGMLAGVGVGLLHRSDKWETVPAAGVLVSVAPHGAGVGIRGTIVF